MVARLAFVGYSSQFPARGRIDSVRPKPCPQPTKKKHVFIKNGIEYRIRITTEPGGYRVEVIMPGENGKKIAQGRSVKLALKALRDQNPGCKTRRVLPAK